MASTRTLRWAVRVRSWTNPAAVASSEEPAIVVSRPLEMVTADAAADVADATTTSREAVTVNVVPAVSVEPDRVTSPPCAVSEIACAAV